MGRLVARECMQCLIQIDEKRKRRSSTWALFFSPLFELPWSYDTWAGCLVTRCGGVDPCNARFHAQSGHLHQPVPYTSINPHEPVLHTSTYVHQPPHTSTNLHQPVPYTSTYLHQPVPHTCTDLYHIPHRVCVFKNPDTWN